MISLLSTFLHFIMFECQTMNVFFLFMKRKQKMSLDFDKWRFSFEISFEENDRRIKRKEEKKQGTKALRTKAVYFLCVRSHFYSDSIENDCNYYFVARWQEYQSWKKNERRKTANDEMFALKIMTKRIKYSFVFVIFSIPFASTISKFRKVSHRSKRYSKMEIDTMKNRQKKRKRRRERRNFL